MVTEAEPKRATERKTVLLRLDPAVHDALARWANDELRSTNAQIEFPSAARSPTRAGYLAMPGDAPPAAAHPPATRPKPAR